jgi:hypothetical protein
MSERTIRRWNQQAKKVIPPGFSVAKHKDLIKRIKFTLEYAALSPHLSENNGSLCLEIAATSTGIKSRQLPMALSYSRQKNRP